MSPVEAACPACGSPIEFKTGSSLVVVCAHCSSLVARGDQKLEDLGKVAALLEIPSVLEIDLPGRYRGGKFRIVGRVQYQHQAGGVWNEWYAAFDDGRWGWLAESGGRLFLTFERKLSKDALLPPLDQLSIGNRFVIPNFGKLLISEIGEAALHSAEGEIPFEITPGEKHRYADLSGGGGKFATLDYSDELPVVYVGEELTLEALGIDPARAFREDAAREITAVHIACPQCGGSLDLRAPDETLRVVCPFCSSLLDAEHDTLRYLSAIDPGKHKPTIPIGTVGHLEKYDYTVIGFMRRSVKFDKTYYWNEYLLHHPRRGFRWLVQSDDHWSLVRSLAPGEIERDSKQFASYQGHTFKLFQDGHSRVVQVLGEFYWKVDLDEVVNYADYIRPPEILSREVTQYFNTASAGEAVSDVIVNAMAAAGVQTSAGGEINWSLGTYLPVDEVEAAFKLKGLKRPTGVAPNQPFPHRQIYWAWGALVLATLLVGTIFMTTGARRLVYDQTHRVEPVTAADQTQIIFSERPVTLAGNGNLNITVNSDVRNSWVYVDGDLFNEESGLVQGFAMPVEYYTGSDSDGPWTEGDRSPEVYLSALPAGTYTLRFEVQWQHFTEPQTFRVRIIEDRPRLFYLLMTILAVSIVPLCILIWHFSFTRRRWADSDYNPYAGWTGSDDD